MMQPYDPEIVYVVTLSQYTITVNVQIKCHFWIYRYIVVELHFVTTSE